MSKIYIVGESLGPENKWIFQGAYTTHDAALSKCVDDGFFILGAYVDFDEPREMREPEFMYYPRFESRPEHPDF